jgi:hypothetical protein
LLPPWLLYIVHEKLWWRGGMGRPNRTFRLVKKKTDVLEEAVPKSPFSSALHERMSNHSLKAALGPALDAAHEEFLKGDRFVLFDVILFCATLQAVIPSWAVDALLDIGEGISSGEVKDMNDAFGPIRGRIDSRRRQHRLLEAENDVVTMLLRVRGEGYSLGAAYAFEEAAERLKSVGVKVNRRDVEDIYRRPYIKELITNWPMGTEWKGGSGTARPRLRDWKRASRPLWEDKDAG